MGTLSDQNLGTCCLYNINYGNVYLAHETGATKPTTTRVQGKMNLTNLWCIKSACTKSYAMYTIHVPMVPCNVYHTRPYGPLISSTVQRWPKVKKKNLQGSKHLTTVWTRWHQGTIGLSHWVIVMSEVVSRGLRVVLRAPSAISRQPWIWCLDSFGGFVTPFPRTLNEVQTLATLTAHFVAV